MNKITAEDIKNLVLASKIDDVKMGNKTTVMCLTLPNGFEIVASSSCVDANNYDHELGKEMCLRRVEEKIWELEGYLLQSNISMSSLETQQIPKP
jgi:hypothetical protein